MSAIETARQDSRCLSRDRTLVELFAKLVSALKGFRDNFGGAVRYLEDASDYNKQLDDGPLC
jgi:hypothetical protein